MTETTRDQWAQWLLHRRHGGDPDQLKTVLDFLYPIRDRVLENARLGEGETLLDVGCGDGLIAFGALEKVKSSIVIFSDISQDLLDHTETLTREMGLNEHARFLRAPANDLSALPDSTIDAVTTRSVLIYVAAKQKAFDEFLRVLKPGGRLSIFEPINRFGCPEPTERFAGYDVTPVMDIAAKVGEVYLRAQPVDTDPMMDFDEHDMLAFAEKSGFRDIHMELEATVVNNTSPQRKISWEMWIKASPNPKAPTLEEAMREALTPAEQETFVAHLRPLVEAGQSLHRQALMYLWAVK